ncbi:MAG: DUF541 domain-containing protein [Anaerolineales bacterium]|nr:DUF541 domain-containing protein [Anaerolineales bacterium]
MRRQSTILSPIKAASFFLVLVLLITGCASDSAAKSTEEIMTLSATGYGQASGTPDLANVQMGVSIIDSDIGVAINQANSTIQEITNAVVAQGVNSSDVRTTNYSVWTEDIYDNQTGQPTGESRYRADISLELTVRNVQKIGDVISAGLEAGANNIHGILFIIEDTTALEDEARDQAMVDVRERAEKLAEGLDMTLGNPISIGEGVTGAPGPIYNYGLKGGGGGIGGGQPSTISPGETTISMQVTVIYELLP